MPKGRDARIGHAYRAHGPRLGLAEKREHRRVRDMLAFPFLPPADAVNAMLHRERHKPMVGRMKLDLIDPSAETVEGLKLRRIAVGVLSPLQSVFAPRGGPQHLERLLDPISAMEPGGLSKRAVFRIKVAPPKGRRRVRDLMRFEVRLRGVDSHRPYP